MSTNNKEILSLCNFLFGLLDKSRYVLKNRKKKFNKLLSNNMALNFFGCIYESVHRRYEISVLDTFNKLKVFIIFR